MEQLIKAIKNTTESLLELDEPINSRYTIIINIDFNISLQNIKTDGYVRFLFQGQKIYHCRYLYNLNNNSMTILYKGPLFYIKNMISLQESVIKKWSFDYLNNNKELTQRLQKQLNHLLCYGRIII